MTWPHILGIEIILPTNGLRTYLLFIISKKFSQKKSHSDNEQHHIHNNHIHTACVWNNNFSIYKGKYLYYLRTKNITEVCNFSPRYFDTNWSNYIRSAKWNSYETQRGYQVVNKRNNCTQDLESKNIFVFMTMEII